MDDDLTVGVVVSLLLVLVLQSMSSPPARQMYSLRTALVVRPFSVDDRSSTGISHTLRAGSGCTSVMSVGLVWSVGDLRFSLNSLMPGGILLVSKLVGVCFEPSQPLGITSGLNTNSNLSLIILHTSHLTSTTLFLRHNCFKHIHTHKITHISAPP